MKKRSLLLLLAAFLLLFCACRKNEEPDTPLTGGTAETEPGGDEGSEQDMFFEENGYPADYAIRFEAGENGFDTAAGELRAAGVLYAFDFTPKLANLYYDASEKNFSALPEDLTLFALTGTAAPEGTLTYRVSITAGGVTHTVLTDAEALNAGEGSDISNFGSLVREFLNLIPVFAAGAAPK